MLGHMEDSSALSRAVSLRRKFAQSRYGSGSQRNLCDNRDQAASSGLGNSGRTSSAARSPGQQESYLCKGRAEPTISSTGTMEHGTHRQQPHHSTPTHPHDTQAYQAALTPELSRTKRNAFVSFKSKSLDLLGSVRGQRMMRKPAAASEADDARNLTMPGAAIKRQSFLMRKHTNSAPDSFETPTNSRNNSTDSQSSASNIVSRGLEAALRTSALFTWSSIEAHQVTTSNQPSFIEMLEDQLKSGPEMTKIEHLSDLHYPDADPPCHFCSNQSSLSIHDTSRLKIVSGGRVRGRDGSRESINPPYINLPSPNVQEEEASKLFPGTMPNSPSSRPCERRQREEEQSEPPASVLTRRRAIVPPKIPPYSPYNVDSSEETEAEKEREQSFSCAESDNSGFKTRRSSIVVIPPMQICPGDLLVYSKVLTQRNNLIDWDGSTHSLAVDADGGHPRKHKNSWSLLRLFDRSGRTKSESLSGLEEVLTCLQPSTFFDDQLSRYKGLCWPEFVNLVQNKDAIKHCVESPTSQPPPAPLSLPPAARSNARLVRQATQSDYSSRLREWANDRRARFGISRTMSERSLDRKQLHDASTPLNASPPLPHKHTNSGTSEKDSLLENETQNEVLPPPSPVGSKNEQRRKEALWNLFQSECAFLYDHLMVLKNVYMDPLKKVQVEGYAMFAEPDILFGNLDELCCVTYGFCKEFVGLLVHNTQPNGDICTTEVLVKLFQTGTKANMVSQAYHRYALNYINALNYLETLRRHIEFCEFEKWCNRDPRCKKLQLTDLLVAPVQHIMKVPLLLRDIETRTEDAQDKEVVTKILETQETSLRELDDKMKWLKNFERLLEIQRNLVWPSVLDMEAKTFIPEFLKMPLAKQPCEKLIVSPRRQIILEGPLGLLDSSRPSDMHVILFDDMLLITRKKKGLGKKKSSLSENWGASCSRSCLTTLDNSIWRYVVFKQPLSLDRFFLHEVTANEAVTAKLEHAFVIISINRFQQITAVYTFQASSDQVKHTWVTKIKETQEKWKRTLQTTIFRAQRNLYSATPVPTRRFPHEH